MSCRHDLANGTCIRCYPSNPWGKADSDRVDPGPEEDYEPNLEGPGAMTVAEWQAMTEASGVIDAPGRRPDGFDQSAIDAAKAALLATATRSGR